MKEFEIILDELKNKIFNDFHGYTGGRVTIDDMADRLERQKFALSDFADKATKSAREYFKDKEFPKDKVQALFDSKANELMIMCFKK